MTRQLMGAGAEGGPFLSASATSDEVRHVVNSKSIFAVYVHPATQKCTRCE